jgi:ankyrin repeat protein
MPPSCTLNAQRWWPAAPPRCGASRELLLARGADVNAKDNSGRSALWAVTVMETNTGFITLLGEHGANVNAQGSSGQTALMKASDMCRDWEIKALLDVGAGPSVADKSGRTALQPELASSPDDPKCKTSRDVLPVRRERQFGK